MEKNQASLKTPNQSKIKQNEHPRSDPKYGDRQRQLAVGPAGGERLDGRGENDDFVRPLKRLLDLLRPLAVRGCEDDGEENSPSGAY